MPRLPNGRVQRERRYWLRNGRCTIRIVKPAFITARAPLHMKGSLPQTGSNLVAFTRLAFHGLLEKEAFGQERRGDVLDVLRRDAGRLKMASPSPKSGHDGVDFLLRRLAA